MRYTVIISFLAIVTACCSHCLILVCNDFDFSWEEIEYSFLMALIILAIPVIAIIVIFKWLLLKFRFPANQSLRWFLQIACMFILLQLSLLCWTIMDMQFFDTDYTYTTKNIVNAYKSLYLIFLPTTIIVPIFIIFIDRKYPGILNYLSKRGF